MRKKPSLKQNAGAIAQLLSGYLSRSTTLRLDGVGTLRSLPNGELEFKPETGIRIFIGYASEDFPRARRLYRDLKAAGFQPWLDREKLLPGQNWPRAIERAIEVADIAILCFSKQSLSRRSYFHSELRYVLECAERMPLEGVFFVPVRFDSCDVPISVSRQYQWVDLFPDWKRGVERIAESVRSHVLLEKTPHDKLRAI
jgi:hypothetical protein